MASTQNRSRLPEFTNGRANDAAPNLGLPAIGQTWNNGGIWGSTIGSGLRTIPNEQGRLQNRPSTPGNVDPSLSRPSVSAAPETTEGITGSGSLLSTSESEPWGVRRGSSQWTAVPSLTNGLSNNTHAAGTASPVRARTNQHTRSNSPFTNGQLSAMGPTNGNTTRSPLDPRARGFNVSAAFNGNFEPGLSARQEDLARRPQFSNFNQLGANGGLNYSGYNSSAASRSGSLPPSRHGTEQESMLGDGAFSSLHTSNSDIFSARTNRQSRPSFMGQGGNRFKDANGWNQPLGGITAGMNGLDFEQEGSEMFPPQQQVPPSPSRTNGGFNPWAFQRNGSVSYEPESRLHAHPYMGPHGDRSRHSPSDSETRRSHADSPLYFTNTPPGQDHHRAPSNTSLRSNLSAAGYNQAALEYKLRLVEQQQAFNAAQQGLATPYGRPFYPYDTNNAAYARMNVNHQYPSGPPSIASYSGNQGHSRGPPRGPSTDTQSQAGLRSQLLEEFRASKNPKRYELKDIYGHVVEFSGDQHGSRFIQTKLESANSDEKAQLFNELLPNARQLITDVFGNYVIQKFFEHGDQTQKKQLADKMRVHVAELSLSMYGCRVVQKAFEHILTDQQALLVKELESQVMKCVQDQNGNHVIQKAIQCIPAEHITFITDAFTGKVQTLAQHPYGCRVVQRMLEHSPQPARHMIIEELHACAQILIIDQYGNYVAQHFIEHGRPEDRDQMIDLTLKDLVNYAKHKFASNVVEKCIIFGTDEQRKQIMEKVMVGNELHIMVGHEFGNYVIQKLLRTLKSGDYELLVEKLDEPLAQARRQAYGRQIGQIEKLIESQKPTKKPGDSKATNPSTSTGASEAGEPVATESETAAEPALVTSNVSLETRVNGTSPGAENAAQPAAQTPMEQPTRQTPRNYAAMLSAPAPSA